MKKLVSVTVAAAMLVSIIMLSACSSKKAETKPATPQQTAAQETPKPVAQPINLKLAHYTKADHPGNLAAKQFAEAVEKRTNGAIKVSVFPNNELGAPPELLEQNILGAIDMSLPTQGNLDKYSKKFSVVGLPFAFNSYDQAHKVLDGPFMDWAAPDLEKQGLIFLSNWEYGFRNITNNVKAINAPEDVKGLKIRIPPNLQLQALMEALGASPQKISYAELYMSLKQNVVDGEENPIATIYADKLYEVQKHLALSRHIYESMVHVMSKKVWEKLTPDQQKIVKEESIKAGNFMRKTITDNEAEQIKKLKELGMQVTEPNLDAFRKKMDPAYKTISDYAGKENVDKFLQMISTVK